MSRPIGQPWRVTFQAGFVLLSLCLLAVPPVVVLSSPTATVDALWVSLRIAGLEAFTVLFMNLAQGAFRPFFSRLVRPFLAHRLHVVVGVVGFALAVGHGLCVLLFGIAGYPAGGVWIGPGMLVVLTAALATAFLRTRLRSTWRHVHRLNYALFLAAFLHGSVLGSDLRTNRFLLGCAVVYVVTVVSGYVYRLFRGPHAAQRAQP